MRDVHVCGHPFQCTHSRNGNNSNDKFQRCCSSESPSISSGRSWNRTPQPYWDDMNVRVNPTIDVCDPWGGGVDLHGQRRPGSRIFCSRSVVNVCDHPDKDDQMLIIPPQHSSISVIDLNWLETPGAHILKADVPGLRKEDLSILIEGEVVKIRGQRTLDYFSNCLNKQLTWYIPFRWQFALPPNVIAEEIKAFLDHGVLTLTIPKIPIVPSIAWFIPVERSSFSPLELQPNSFINIEDEPELSPGSNEGPSTQSLRVSPVLPRTRSLSESNVSFILENDSTSTRSGSRPSTPKIQNIIVKKRDQAASVIAVPCEDDASSSQPQQQQHTIDIAGPTSSPKTLSVFQEDGKKPNAHVTLNININTGKIVKGESSSQRREGSGGAFINQDLGDEDYSRNYRDSVTGNSGSYSNSPFPSRSGSVLRQRPSRVQFDDDIRNDRQKCSDQFKFPLLPTRGGSTFSRSSTVDSENADEDLDSERFQLAPRDQHMEQAAEFENISNNHSSRPSVSKPSMSSGRTGSKQHELQQQQDDGEMDDLQPSAQRNFVQGKQEESLEDEAGPSGQLSPHQRRRRSSPKEERFKGRLPPRRMTTGEINASTSQPSEPQIARRKTEGDSPSNRDQVPSRGSRRPSEAPRLPKRGKSKMDKPSNDEPVEGQVSAEPVEEDANQSAPSASRKNKRASQAALAKKGGEALTKKEKELLQKRASLPLSPKRKSSAAEKQGGPKTNEKRKGSLSRRASEAAQEEAGEITNSRSFERRRTRKEEDDIGP